MKSQVYLALTVLTILSYFQSNAQNQFFGLNGGMNISNFHGSAAEGLTPKIGFHVGGFASLPLSKRITYQPEVTFSREGSEFEDSDFKSHFDYLNVSPLLFKFFPGFEGINIQAGIQVGLLINAKSVHEDEEFDIKEFYLKENTSAIIGLGYEYNNYIISARYNLGLYSILDDTQDPKLLSRVIQLSIGIGF